ncbi:MAG TPA: ABC transporter permease [Opitutaceae bacterium]|nr:ABC transporter permease [Opitutaceae bacterium]
MNDLRFAIRQFAKTPGVTATIILSLGLGIAAIATVLCWTRRLVTQPLPGVADQDRIVAFVSNQGGGCASLPDLRDIADTRDVFAGFIATMPTPVSLTVDRHTEWTDAQIVSANYFQFLGVHPILGRVFRPEEDRQPGGNPVAVISERLWRRRFAADPGVIGRSLELNRRQFTIVGVAPGDFDGTLSPAIYDVWVPLSMIWEARNQGHNFLTQRDARGWHNLGRLQPGVSLGQAQGAIRTLNARLAAAYPNTNREIRYQVVPLSRCPWGAQVLMGPVLRLLLAVTVGVLLIVAANVANLLLARAVRREKEIAVRIAAGATRAQLLRLLLTESLLLALAGGAVGILVSVWLVDTIPLLFEASMNLRLSFTLDPTTVGLATLVAIATGLLFGLAPAVHASRTDLAEALKAGARGSSPGRIHRRLRTWLVVSEVALALVLLVGAGLCVAGLRQARRVDLGLNPDGVLMAGLQIGMNGYTPDTGLPFYRALRERAAAIPGARDAALASWFPLGLAGCKGSGVIVEGRPRPPGEELTYEYAIVSPHYFSTLQIPFVAGRDFTDADDAAATSVAIVNEAFARRFWPGTNPLGRSFRTGGKPRTVVGVVKTGKYNRLDEAPDCFFYLPYLQGVPDLDLGICVRTEGDPAGSAPALRAAVQALDPNVELRQTMTLRTYTQAVLIPQRVASSLLTLIGGVALILAAMGVYAVIASAVTERTREFGVRVALGATRTGVIALVLRQALGLVGGGLLAGTVVTLALTRLLHAFLFGVSPFDPTIFGTVALLLLLTGLLACYLPARRATQISPIEALRAE